MTESQRKMIDQKTIDRFFKKVKKTESCWIWEAFINNDGYGLFRFYGKMIRSHRVSYLIHYGPIKEKLCVLHSCDNPACVNPDHLRLGTQRQNTSDCISRGRFKVFKNKPGHEHPSAKLSKEAVEFIKGSNFLQTHLAKMFGVQQQCISKIKTGQRHNKSSGV